MAIAKAWSTGQTNHPLIPQLRPSLSSSSSSSSSINFIKKPLLKPSQNLHCCCNANNNDNENNNNSCTPSTAADWDWKRWTHHFSEIEQAETNASFIKFKLEDAVNKENYREAATLKTEFLEATSKDSVHEIMSQFKDAIKNERYHDASHLYKNTGSGLVGWWTGCSKNTTDPFGKIIHITPEIGRFVGKSYSPRQLFTSTPGIPLFEIFVVKNDDDTYTMQVVYLRQNKGSKTSTSSDVKLNENDLNTKEGIKSVNNDLTDNKLINIKISEVIENNDSLNQLMENNEEKSKKEEDSDLINQENQEDEKNKSHIYVRESAEILDTEKDSFVLKIAKESLEYDKEVDITQLEEDYKTISESLKKLIPPKTVSPLFSTEVVKDLCERLKLALELAQKYSSFSEYTNFNRIKTWESNLDPFEGLFVGEFAPYGPQVVQLKRKYGNWDENNEDGSVNSKFFEYVEAVKITGDLQVPAGEVTFRAEIGKEFLTKHRKSWPKEFGVVASYRGQGRYAEPGFQNPEWVLGEFLHLNRKSEGASFRGDLGFIYAVPNKQAFMVLLKRLILPE